MPGQIITNSDLEAYRAKISTNGVDEITISPLGCGIIEIGGREKYLTQDITLSPDLTTLEGIQLSAGTEYAIYLDYNLNPFVSDTFPINRYENYHPSYPNVLRFVGAFIALTSPNFFNGLDYDRLVGIRQRVVYRKNLAANLTDPPSSIEWNAAFDLELLLIPYMVLDVTMIVSLRNTAFLNRLIMAKANVETEAPTAIQDSSLTSLTNVFFPLKTSRRHQVFGYTSLPYEGLFLNSDTGTTTMKGTDTTITPNMQCSYIDIAMDTSEAL